MIDRIRRAYADHDWQSVTVGMSGARVWRLVPPVGGARSRELYLKTAPVSPHPDPGFHPEAEAERCAWLRKQGLPAPEVVEHGATDDREWLLTTAVPGRTVAEHWPAADRGAVVDAMADFARELHRLPVADCPFRRDPDSAVPDAARAVELALVDTEDFDDQRLGTQPSDLLAELRRTCPAAVDPVVSHGDYCVPNVLVDPETLRVTGVIDLGRLGVADRHQDLALAHRSLRDEDMNEQYGPDAADRFLARYGIDPDPAMMAWHELLDEFF